MGFYGNITNVAKTQFQFDKIYPNRKEMDQRVLNDGVYLGRYVLVEYDDEYHLDTLLRVQFKNGKAYYNPQGETSFATLVTKKLIGKDELVYTADSALTPETGLTPTNCIFYKCTSKKSNSSDPATFELAEFSSSNYTTNYHIDTATYGQGRGYDSTVWQKVYTDNTEKYVMIAELNTIVPTFDVVAEAPTMNPVVPHFDTESTDVYYKLHWQTPWGFRVAAANKEKSDITTQWTTTTYNSATGKNEVSTPETKNAAIYFNKDAFEKQIGKQSIKKKDTTTTNEIKVVPTSSGQAIYDDHNPSTKNPVTADDIQELTINLPAIGNMMSDAWDIIHGPNRDNARTDANSSLQGRLNSFDAFYDNQIPIKRATDGTIIGSRINGASNYDADIDLLTLPEGANGTVTGFTGDDAWIETKINTTALKAGDKGSGNDQANNSGISIHHTFHATQNSTSTVDKNNGNSATGANYKQAHIRSTNSHHNNDDKIDLYVPYVDAKGHVVGHNIETVTLPYGYKTIKVTNTADNIVTTPATTIKSKGQSADSTQDTLTFTASNRWIKFDNNTEDTIKVGHLLSPFSEGTSPNTLYGLTSNHAVTDLDTDNTFEVPCLQFDEAGHILEARTHTVTLPENFTDHIVMTSDETGADNESGTAGTITPDTLTDELTFAEGNRWINIAADSTNDKITVSHYVKGFTENTNATDFNAAKVKKTFDIQELTWDRAGHITASTKHTYTMPDNFKTIVIKNEGSSIVTGGTQTNAEIVADTLTDAVTINSGNRWISLKGDANNDTLIIYHEKPDQNSASIGTTYTTAETPTFGATFTIPEVKYDETGHIHNVSTHTVTMPKGSLEDEKVTTTTANVLTNISFDVTSGKISVEHDNAANLLLTDLTAINADSKWVQATDDIKGAFNKLDTRLDKEIARAIDGETVLRDQINSLNYSETADYTQIITQITQTNGKITEVGRAAAGTLVLGSGYSIAEGTITAKDSLNTAFGKLEKSLAEEKARAESAEGQVLANAKAYTDTVKANLLGDGIKDTFDTLVEIQSWIEGDGVNTTELTTAISNESLRAQGAEMQLQQNIDSANNAIGAAKVECQGYTDNAINALGSAAYREEIYFVSKAKYDLDMSTKDAQITGLNVEAKRLTNEVIALQERLTELENLIKSQVTE